MVSAKKIVIGLLAIAAVVTTAGCIEKPSAPSEETRPTPELAPTPAPTPTASEIMTDEEIDSLMQTIENIEAIESELNITEIDLNVDFE